MRTAKGLALDPDERAPANNRWDGLTLAERFWAKVDKSGDCWLWQGCLNKRGYGSFGITSRRTELAHRVASVFTYGALPAGMLVLHKRECTSKACCRPDHTYRGSQKQNMADARAVGVLIGRNVARGRAHYMRRRKIARRTNGQNMSKTEATKAIRAAVFERAAGHCESCGRSIGDEGQMDHEFGRVRVPQSVENCWGLCRGCHESKTLNDPSRAFWLLKFLQHCHRYRLFDAAERAQAAVEWDAAKKAVGG